MITTSSVAVVVVLGISVALIVSCAIANTGTPPTLTPTHLPVGSPSFTPSAIASAALSPAPATASATSGPALLIEPGDLATGHGYIVGRDDEGFRLCPARGSAGITLGGQPTSAVAQCPSLSVAVDAVSGAQLPGLTALATGVRSGYITVSGTWSGTALTVTSMTRATPVRDVPPALPAACTRPDTEWPGDIGRDATGETALRPLADAISSDPATYLDYWRVPIDANNVALGNVTIVGTVADPLTTEQKLSPIFPHNLCVVSVSFANADLQPLVKRLGNPDGSWQAAIDLSSDRVLVALPAVTGDALATIGGDFDRVALEPVIEPIAR